MSGAESQNKRDDLWPHEPGPNIIYREDLWCYDHFFSPRAEEEREAAAAALRREIRELEQEQLVFIERQHLDLLSHGPPPKITTSSSTIPFTMSGVGSQDVRDDLWPHEPGPHLPPSFLTIPFTMGGLEEDERAEEKREAASALRREIMEMESMEERLVFLRSSTIPFTMSGVKEKLQYFKRLCEEDEWSEEETVQVPAMDREIMEMKFLEEQFALKREDLLDYEPDPFFFPGSEEEREDPPAKRPEIMALMKERLALKREDLWDHLLPRERGPFFFPGLEFSAEEERADSPASSCGSMMSDDSMVLLVEF